MKETLWSAALCYANPLNLGADVAILEASGCGELHVDVKDGVFTQGFAMGLETIEALAQQSTLPVHAHLQIERPERHINDFVKAGCKRITIHVESTVHAHRALQQIINAGVQAGIAVKPATPLTKLEYLMGDVDCVHVITEDRDIARRVTLAGALDRVKILRDNLDYAESRATLSVEGFMTPKHTALCVKHGADMIVMDDAAVFAEGNLAANIEAFKAQITDELAVL
ncbi:MAG: ribulose-phosphate 3-epimerase [Candidatus Hydrogenedentota bacterium]